MTDSAGAVRQQPGTLKVAVRMGPGVTAGDYFVLDPDHGGYYSSGAREGVVPDPENGVEGWPVMVVDDGS